MAVKTITIDLEAYEALRRLKRPGQSFSDVIKERFRGKSTAESLLSALDAIALDSYTLDALDSTSAARKKSPARAPKL
jgi:predicted CopG family antitoxin